MGRKKVLCTAMAFVLYCVGASACAKQPEVPRVEVGGTPAEKPLYADYEFSGLKDFHLRADVTNYDFLAEVTVDDDGNAVTPTCNASLVKFGVPGTYPITYSYQNVKKERSVNIYGSPQIQVGSDAVFSYAEAYEELFSDTSAKDSFGKSLEVFLVEDDGLYASDGTLCYGDFELLYGALDAAGQLVTGLRRVRVEQDTSKEPILGAATYDLADEKLSVSLQLNGGIFVGASLNDILVPSESCAVRENTLFLDGDFLAANVGVGNKTLRVTTNLGYAETEATITDNMAPQISAKGNNYIYPVDTVVTLPDAERLNGRQNYTLIKLLLDSDDNPVTITNGKFTADKAGVYRYLLDAVKPDDRSYRTEVNVRIATAEEYESIIDLALSDQFTDRWKKPSNNDGDFAFGYDSTAEIAGVKGCLYMTSGKTGAWYNRIELVEHNNLGYLSSVDVSKYSKITAKMYFTEATDLIVWLNGSDVRYSTGVIKIYDDTAQTYVAYSNIASVLNKWVTVEIPVGTYNPSASNKRLALGIGQGTKYISTTVYMADVKFAV